MVQCRNRPGGANRVHVALQRWKNAFPEEWFNRFLQAVRIDMDWNVIMIRRDLLSVDREEQLPDTEEPIQALRVGDVVVVRDCEKRIETLLVPASNGVRRTVSLAVDRVRVQIALVPLKLRPLAGQLGCLRDPREHRY